MKNIYFLVKKNLKLLLRAKSSALIVLLAPLMLILLIGFSYNTSQTGLNIGVQASSFTDETNSFLDSLQNEGYKVVKYEKTEDCVGDIKSGFVHTCLVLPDNFQIQDNSPKEILFYVDQTKINLVYLITDTFNKKFNLKSQEISQELASGLLTKLSNTKTKIEEKSSLVDQTKTKNQEALSQTTTLKSDLASLDLTPPANIYNLSLLSSFQGQASTHLSESSSLLAAAKSSISASDLNSSDKSALKSDLVKVETQLAQLQTLVNGTGPNTLSEVSSLLSSLQADLDSTKAKLTAASAKVSSADSQLASLTASLNEGLTSLDAIKTTLAEIQADLVSQKVTDPSTISSPLITKIEKITAEKSHLNYLFPSLMVLVVMFISLLLGTTLVMMEKHNQAYFRNFVVPVKKITFIFSTYLTNSLLVLIQIAIILAISLIFLKDALPQFPLTTLILFVSSSVFTLVGMALGYLFTSEDTGTLASISAGSLFLFVSGLVLPLESMPAAVRQITSFNPFVIGEKLVREIFIFKSSFPLLLSDLLLLLGYTLVLFLLLLVIDSFTRQHFLTRLLYLRHKHLREKKAKIN